MSLNGIKWTMLPHFGCPLVNGALQFGSTIKTDGWVACAVIPKNLKIQFAQHESQSFVTVEETVADEYGEAALVLDHVVSADLKLFNNEALVGFTEYYNIHSDQFVLKSLPD